MNLSNTDTRWGLVAQGFHWLMFLVIAGAWFAVENHENFPKGSDERAQWMMIHKSLGLTIFFLVWLRIGARLSMPTPAAVGEGFLLLVSKVVGLGLYALMIAMPVTGLLASQFYGKPVSWFGVFEIPVVLGEDKAVGKQLMELHEAGFGLLLFLLLLHVGGALKHHFIAKNDVLTRMLPWGK